MRKVLSKKTSNYSSGRRTRSERGLLGTMLLLMAIVTCLSLSLFAIDFSHLVSVRAQLRNAADAAALGGAQDLFAHPEMCQEHAYSIAAANLADGLPVKATPAILTVDAVTVPPSVNGNGTVTVDVSMKAKNLISPLIGRLFDTLKVRAVAGGAGQLVKTFDGTAFPLAVDLNTRPGPTNNPLPSLAMAAQNGGTFDIVIQGDTMDNGGWTNLLDSKSVPASLLAEYLGSLLGSNSHGANSSTPDTQIPPVYVGEPIGIQNGHASVSTEVSLDPWKSILLNPDRKWILPIINTGDNKFNQTSPIVGFVTVNFTAVQAINARGQGGQGLTLSAKILDVTTPGLGGTIGSTGNSYSDTSLTQVAPQVVKLLQ